MFKDSGGEHLENDFVLITGASSDIGMALLRQILVGTTTNVVAHGFSGIERFSPLVEEFGDRFIPARADLSVEKGVLDLIDALHPYGVPSSVVHLPAPKLHYNRFTKLRWESLEADLAVQVRSAITILQHLLPKMSKLPRARVVFVLSSVVHGIPPKFMAQYTIAKYTQLGLMRALASEYASTSVRINAVSPSMVETQFVSDISALARQTAASSNPLGRNATPEDIVGAIKFLLSPAADYISGIALPIAAGTAT